VSDPYAEPGSDCLSNKLGITDPEMLAEAEFRLVSIREVQASRSSIPGNFGLGHLQKFHHFLFQDVYTWAGKTRTVDISKPGGHFCHWRYVDDEVSTVLAELAQDGYLVGFNRESFISSLANYYGELNVRHPFREGNGRTIRAFLRQLGAAAGYQLDWSELSKSENIEACRIHLNTTDATMLKAVLDPVVSRIS
jgi:cell filamentation protein